MSGERILKTVKALLPSRLRAADEEGRPGGYADLTVDDGRGKTLLSINVQRWKPNDRRINQLYQDAVSVVISELNAPSYGINAVREKLALTLEELTALALNPAWEQLR